MKSSQPHTLLHLVRNSVSFDSRVLKETGSLSELFPKYDILVAGFYEPGFLLTEDIGKRKVKRFALATRGLPKNLVAQLVKYAEWHCRVVSFYSQYKLSVIHCHDLAPLAIAVHLKMLTGAKLIYDAHELETEMKGLTRLRKVLSKLLEYVMINFVDYIITVSPSIFAWYKRKYSSVPISIVRNIPLRLLKIPPRAIALRDAYGIGPSAILFIYLGGISDGRGVRIILDAFADPSVKHHVLFMGAGPLESEVVASAMANPRIHHRKPVPPSEVVSYVVGADVGLCMYEDTCLNHRYCLPNKLFESIISGLPVVASNLPDQARLVEDYHAGWIVEPNSASLAKLLAGLTLDRVENLKTGFSDRVSNLCWSNEENNLADVYRILLGVCR